MGPDSVDDEKKAPPEILEAILYTVTPRKLRPQLKQDFRATYKSPGQLVRKAAKDLSRLIPGFAWNAFDGALVGAQLFALVVCFLGAPFTVGLIAGLLMGVLILCLRDGHTDPGETPVEALMDAIVVVVFIVASQLFDAYVTSGPPLPLDVIIRGSAAGVMMLFVLRMIMRDPKPATPRETAERGYNVVFAMNAMWGTAWLAIICTSPDSGIHIVNYMCGVLPPVIVFMDMRLRQNSLAPLNAEMPKSLFSNREKAELVRKLSWMWMPKWIASEILFLSMIALYTVAVPLTNSAADRVRVIANAIALLMLFVVWRPLRRANRTAGRLLQAEIAKLDRAEAQ